MQITATTCFIGEKVFLNHGAYLMDGAPITIGAYCFIGPNCGMYTANHPLLAEERETGLEQALPITIGEHCWIGGDVTILPGVTIGSHTVIGAKSVVTTNLPDHVLAVGNPVGYCVLSRKKILFSKSEKSFYGIKNSSKCGIHCTWRSFFLFIF